MSTLVKLVRTSAFRLVALFLLVFAVSAVLFIGYIYYNTNVLLARQLNETIDAEVQGLAEQYRSGGIARRFSHAYRTTKCSSILGLSWRAKRKHWFGR